MRLVADIGGTNARLAFAHPDTSRVEDPKSYRNANFSSFDDVIADFLSTGAARPEQLVVAMAGPVAGNTGRLTNLDWVIDGATLSSRFSGTPVRVINDLTALGYAALQLAPEQLVPVVAEPTAPAAQRQALVVGIGTGFNVSPVVAYGDRTICPAVEAGHTSLFASLASALDRLKPGLSEHFPTVESLFSGRGRRKFLSLMTGETVESATPYIAKHGTSENAVYDSALDDYAMLIGMLLAELKIAYMPTDGIFLAGGVARSSLIADRADICAQAATVPNRFVQLAPSIWIIDDDSAALTGCASVDVRANA
ncbi:MAG: glucokinase [Paracoccaceae bacterium]